jgi:hypothetical protein
MNVMWEFLKRTKFGYRTHTQWDYLESMVDIHIWGPVSGFGIFRL